MDAGIRSPVLRFVVFSHLWLALGAGAQTWWMGELLRKSEWRAPVLAFCGTIVFYTFMRFARMNHPDLIGSTHLTWFRSNRRSVIAMLLAAVIVILLVGARFIPELLRILWPPGLVALLYVVPLNMAGGRTIGLRRFPGMKALLIAIVWSWITVGLPQAIAGRGLLDGDGAWLVVLQFCFFLSLAIAFDVRDLQYDMKSLRTLPQMIGSKGARFFAALFQLPWLMRFLILGWFNADMRGSALPMMLLVIAHLTALVLVAGSSPRRSEAYFSVLLDGMLVLIPLLGWIGTLM